MVSLVLIFFAISNVLAHIPPDGFQPASSLEELIKRDNLGCIRTCPVNGDSMPTWGNWQNCKLSYLPGTGQQISLPPQNQDSYSHNRAGAIWRHDQCYTSVYKVHTETIQLPWRLLLDAVDCSSTTMCSSSKTDSWSQCATWSESLTEVFGLNVPVLSLLTGALGISHTVTYSQTNCVNGSLTSACTWDDDACHALWGSDQVVRMWGYIQRYCDYADDHLPGQVIWSHDFIMDLPTGNIATGCAALCNEGTYDGPERATSLETDTISCTSAPTWNAFAAADAASATETVAANEDVTTQWVSVKAYTTDVRTARTHVPTSIATVTVTKASDGERMKPFRLFWVATMILDLVFTCA